MKTRTYISINTIALLVVALVLTTGCGKKKKLVEAKKPPTGETVLKEYCAGPEYMSDKKNFRASGLGESMDQAVAKKKALSNARAELAQMLETTLTGVVDNYANSRELNNVEEATERFETLTREVINQQLTGVKTICTQPVTVNATGNYKYYVAIELSGADIVGDYNERLSKDDMLKVDYDYEKFKAVFEEEMDKLGN
jgi:hypothetical protein